VILIAILSIVLFIFLGPPLVEELARALRR
jgi:hypothetical protein